MLRVASSAASSSRYSTNLLTLRPPSTHFSMRFATESLMANEGWLTCEDYPKYYEDIPTQSINGR